MQVKFGHFISLEGPHVSNMAALEQIKERTRRAYPGQNFNDVFAYENMDLASAGRQYEPLEPHGLIVATGAEDVAKLHANINRAVTDAHEVEFDPHETGTKEEVLNSFWHDLPNIQPVSTKLDVTV